MRLLEIREIAMVGIRKLQNLYVSRVYVHAAYHFVCQNIILWTFFVSS